MVSLMFGTRRSIAVLVGALLLLFFCTIATSDQGPGTIRFVYLTSSGCQACRTPKYKERIASIRTITQQWAKAHHYDFKTTGVTTDDDKAIGDQFLSETGTYDETVSGKGFDAILPYIEPYQVQNPIAVPGVPQVVVLLEKSSSRPRELYRATGSLILSELTEAANVKASIEKTVRKR